jgi:hypothetical protein
MLDNAFVYYYKGKNEVYNLIESNGPLATIKFISRFEQNGYQKLSIPYYLDNFDINYIIFRNVENFKIN